MRKLFSHEKHLNAILMIKDKLRDKVFDYRGTLHVFAVTFNQFNASLLNKHSFNSFIKQND